jgi:hypothetical protein
MPHTPNILNTDNNCGLILEPHAIELATCRVLPSFLTLIITGFNLGTTCVELAKYRALPTFLNADNNRWINLGTTCARACNMPRTPKKYKKYSRRHMPHTPNILKY